MTQEERYANRDGSYSAWHRRHSTRRFVGIEQAQLLAMIDLDACLYVEYDDGTKEPLALIEVAMDVGQEHKTATVTTNLAKRANIPCLVVLYSLNDKPNPADSKCADIASFRVKRLWPRSQHRDWKILTPSEYAQSLLDLRKYKANQLDSEVIP